jgi:hypothetical protein
MATEQGTPSTVSPFSWWKACGLFLGLVLVFLLFLLAPIYFNYRSHQQRLQAAIAAIRASGDPLDGYDLNRQLEQRRTDPNYSAEYQELYRAISALEETRKEDRLRLWKLDTESYNFPPDVQWYRFEEFEAFYLKRKPLIDRVQALLLHSKLYVPENDYVSTSDEDLSHEFNELREIMRWLSRKYRVLANYQNWPECNAALIAKIIAANQFPQATQSYRASLFHDATADIPEYLEFCHTDDENLRHLQAELAKIDLPHEFLAGLKAERAYTVQTFQSRTLKSFVSPQDLQPPFWLRNKPLSESIPSGCADAVELYNRMITELEAPNVNHVDFWKLITAMRNTNHPELLKKDPNRKSDPLIKKPWHSFINRESYEDNLFYYARVIYKTQTVAQIMAAAVAIKRYRSLHGHLPERLDNLVPEFIDQVPIDFYTQSPLIYTVNHHVMQLYSAGENEIPEGGYESDIYLQKDYRCNLVVWSRIAGFTQEVNLPNGKKRTSSDDIGLELNFGLGDALRRANRASVSD